MRQRAFGAARVACIGQGTWEMERTRAASVKALRKGIDLGLTHIDTAEMYGDGAVEEIVGEAIAGRRDEVFLVTKVLPQNASAGGTRRALEASLRRLRTDHVDCYLLHWRGRIPLAETLDSLAALVREGKARSFGVSNFDEDDLEEAVAIAGRGAIACNQVLYHLEERAVEHAVLPACARHGIALVAYSPFGSGAFLEAASSTSLAILEQVAGARGVTLRQVALAFLLRHESVLAIPKAARVEHVEENAGGDLELTDDEVLAIERAFPLGPKPRTLPTI